MAIDLSVVTFLIALMQGVFCKTWDVMLPQSIVGITESCVTVPCRFEVPNNEEANILLCSDGGIWKKGSLRGPVVFTAQSPYVNVMQGKIVGDLTKKNCTTIFNSLPKNYSDVYFFRLECLKLKYSFSNGVIINSRPELPPSLLTSVGQVSEGAQVRLQCSVPVPCSLLPPSITWLPQDISRQEQTQMQSVEDGRINMISTLTFIASADHHNRSISCSVSYPLTTGGSSRSSATTQRLNVLYAPRVTVATLSTSVPVPEGRVVTFTCWSDANPPVSHYTWYRTDSGKLTKMGEGELLILQVDQTDNETYLCEAQSQRGSQRSRPVSLEVNSTRGRCNSIAQASPYIICGVLLVLYILTVVVVVCKYQSISRRLKRIEVKEEHTNANLRTTSFASDYDQLQYPLSNTTPSPDVLIYENSVACKPPSEIF
ncbi:myelin-associated glycoprotein [Cottoperca gobio]|uniref:Myelin-associated glycoprotein-like n=1 Tax=Cottoperca gobio TaxID=56716 RepID=A0A6J2QL60_COTGO|nr:myelin-associated glycoprotein-like [Cottoperca gobio]XP_029298432.1 myelin-associated glycoprotein-like [Cottoperca gobio]